MLLERTGTLSSHSAILQLNSVHRLQARSSLEMTPTTRANFGLEIGKRTKLSPPDLDGPLPHPLAWPKPVFRHLFLRCRYLCATAATPTSLWFLLLLAQHLPYLFFFLHRTYLPSKVNSRSLVRLPPPSSPSRPPVASSGGADSIPHLAPRSSTEDGDAGSSGRRVGNGVFSALPPSPTIHRERERRRLRKKSHPDRPSAAHSQPGTRSRSGSVGGQDGWAIAEDDGER
ncbi:hypothetical protein HGRIS_001141 [Hohenbuehelia grisea]|uniref:Uncharacterized protein n=1 Tax=Hohenbuehelia grisea TaxID=104357 RepID=A0ABR3JND5_9AGAR